MWTDLSAKFCHEKNLFFHIELYENHNNAFSKMIETI